MVALLFLFHTVHSLYTIIPDNFSKGPFADDCGSPKYENVKNVKNVISHRDRVVPIGSNDI